MLPLSIWSWQDTVKAVLSGKAVVVDIYPDVFVRAVSLDMPVPSVIALLEYAPVGKTRPAFTRRNVFLRDGYRCQYCSELYRTSDLSLDHVEPRCFGGQLTWYVPYMALLLLGNCFLDINLTFVLNALVIGKTKGQHGNMLQEMQRAEGLSPSVGNPSGGDGTANETTVSFVVRTRIGSYQVRSEEGASYMGAISRFAGCAGGEIGGGYSRTHRRQ
mmetsp:Transcript_1997/g.4400  ORF Transcript_1997/g.4400 Transcript_1997/m.4400 type:complete len:216 (+) Transcript_1997:681-1328(+)